MVTKQMVLFFIIGGGLVLLGAGFWLKKSIFIIKQYEESSIAEKEGLAQTAGLYVIGIGVMIFIATFVSQVIGIYAWIAFAILISLSSVMMLKMLTKYI